ncbi:copper homeostasis protein CutC [Hymenobacter volaticus]|uniref:PF03932 family protein CutC n=1 Tax=Hymenobacter volaticus TaxID=2932254 RepID=A0ABY4GCG4_9BACT|nr:copper homeostasis protein CutC [Hymenobacter volaticus]UOQ68592.1 copper homeostasis protein CutC [Hymenobacter volaticus]
MKRVLEICASSVQSAVAAQAGGAHRIELCQNLEQGGITPSFGLLSQVLKLLSIPVFVLIRPRPGNFVYDTNEQAIMVADIIQCRAAGCAGVVLGALTREGRVDITVCQKLIEAAGPLSVTFHRAFDVCSNQAQALEEIIGLGCQRILTSGGEPAAPAAQAKLAALVKQAADRISIMPGSGVTPHTIRGLIETTGANEFHASAKHSIASSSAPFSPMFDAILPEAEPMIVAELVTQLDKHKA